MSLGSKLRELRERRGLDQISLAAKVGVTQSYISLLEKDKGKPSLDVLERLAGVLGVVDKDFFFEATDEVNVPIIDLLNHFPKEDRKFLENDAAKGYVTFIRQFYEMGLTPEDLEAILDIVKRGRKMS